MEKEPKTKAFFVKSLDEEILAVFPENLDGENVGCYVHVGQHSYAEMYWIEEYTVSATEAEYADLKKELEDLVGYNIELEDKRPKTEKWPMLLTYNEALYCVVNDLCNVMGTDSGAEEDEEWWGVAKEFGDIDYDEDGTPYFTVAATSFAANNLDESGVKKIEEELRSEKFLEFLRKEKLNDRL